jgi:hypothetical protein
MDMYCCVEPQDAEGSDFLISQDCKHVLPTSRGCIAGRCIVGIFISRITALGSANVKERKEINKKNKTEIN